MIHLGITNLEQNALFKNCKLSKMLHLKIVNGAKCSLCELIANGANCFIYEL